MNFIPLFILILLILIILFFGLYVLFHKKKRFSDNDIESFKKIWAELEKLVVIHPDQAVLKADKLLDHVLKKSGYSGTLGEKLKNASSVFRSNNSIWSAHKLRNHIAHDIHANISKKQALFALKAFRQALYDLGIKL